MVSNYIDDLGSLLVDGIVGLFNFIIELPNLFNKLLNFIPSPLYGILKFFVSIFLTLIIIYAIARFISTMKGG